MGKITPEPDTKKMLFSDRSDCIITDIFPHLFNCIQRGSYRNGRHDNYGCSIIVVVLGTPQNNTEELEDVKRIQDLLEEEKEPH